MDLTSPHESFKSGLTGQRQTKGEVYRSREFLLLILKKQLPCCEQGHMARNDEWLLGAEDSPLEDIQQRNTGLSPITEMN